MKKLLLWLSLSLLSLAICVACRNSDRYATVTTAVTSTQAVAAVRGTLVLGTAGAAPSAPLEMASEARAASSAWSRPFLYRGTFEHKDVYLFGTIHLPDPRLDAFPPSLRAAIAESEVVFTEIPMDEATQSSIAPTLMLKAGQRLAQTVPPALYDRVLAAFADAGIPFEPFERMKPWAVSVQLSVLDRLMTLALKKPLDAIIHQQAQEQGKKTDALETAREQLSIFDRLNPEEQIELLRLTIDYRDAARAEGRDVIAELLNAYVLGDEVGITKLVREAFDPKSALSLKLLTRTLTDRNRSMAERMMTQLTKRPEHRLFFAVGCGHVAGDDGIVARLRKRNVVLTRVAP